MERNNRKVLAGRVVSDKMDKTITAKLKTKRNQPVHGKRINYSKNTKHMMKTMSPKKAISYVSWKPRPLSATKRFRLVEAVEEAVII